MVQATDKSATCRLMIVLCVCSFCGLVADWFRRQRNVTVHHEMSRKNLGAVWN